MGEHWRLGLVEVPADTAGAIGGDILALSGDGVRVLGVWSEGIELRKGEVAAAGPVRGVGGKAAGDKRQDKGKGKDKAGAKDKPKAKGKDNTPKQGRISRAWALPSGQQLTLVEQTSFDLDKVGGCLRWVC